MSWWRPGQSLVAVDWGTTALRAVQLGFGQGQAGVIHWLNVEPPLGGPSQPAASSDHAAPSRSGLATGLEQFDCRRGGLVAGTSEVEYCLLNVPEAVWSRGPDELVEAIRWEVGRQLSRPVEDAELGAWPLPGPMASGANTVAVAAPRTRIVEAVESLAQGRLECEWVEPAALALIRACRATAPGGPGEIWGVLDLGYSTCRLYLAVESTPVFARHVRGSGHAWTELIARELRIEYGLAEHYKRKCGIESGPRGARSLAGTAACLDETALPGVLSAVLRGPLTDLVADVEKAFCFVMEQYPRRQAGGLVLVGGGSRMPGLPDFITGSLGVRTIQAGAQRVLDVPASHPMSRPDIFSVMAGCVGLAFGEHRS